MLIDRLRSVAAESQQSFLQALSPTDQKTLISLLRQALDANDAARGTASHDAGSAGNR